MKRGGRSTAEIERLFGRVVRLRREELAITQDELSDRAHLHRTYISQIERGLKSPSLSALDAIAGGLLTRPSVLLSAVEALQDTRA